MSSKAARRFAWDEVLHVAFVFAVLILLSLLRAGVSIHAQAPPAPVPHRTYFTQPSNSYWLDQAALEPPLAMAPMVSVNGLVMTEGTDFYIDGSSLIFTGTDVADMVDPTVQVFYWAAQ